MSGIAPSAKAELPKQKTRSLEHALLSLFQIERVFGPISEEQYFQQDQWFMQEVMGRGLDRNSGPGEFAKSWLDLGFTAEGMPLYFRELPGGIFAV